MTEFPPSVTDELEGHDAFEPEGDTYALTTTVFDATVTAEETDDGTGRFRVTVSLPTLDAAVAGETVATVVEDGWYETLERRLEDVFTVASGTSDESTTVDRGAETVTVTLEYEARDAPTGVADAKALIEYVEGTFAQGVIPGYEYRGPAATLLENAQNRGQRASDGDGSSGGMPM